MRHCPHSVPPLRAREWRCDRLTIRRPPVLRGLAEALGEIHGYFAEERFAELRVAARKEVS